MRQTVEKILSGKFDYEKGALDLSVSRIELALCPGEEYAGAFVVQGIPGRNTEGHVFCNDMRMRVVTTEFKGDISEIYYTFNAKGLEEGDVIQGEIVIISNQGEFYLPYVATIQAKTIDSSLGNIKNLFHFTNLAKSNWDEAVKLFYSDRFPELFSGNDLRYKKIYTGLSAFYGNEQNVEEFLLSINKKQPVEFIPERDVITINDPMGIIEEYINITRNGWGYTDLNVEAEGDFLSVSKPKITDNDFLGNYLSFPVIINPDNIHGGINYGRLHFFNSYCSFEVKVVINNEIIQKSDLSRHLEYSNAKIELLTYYEAFRTKKISVDTWLTETGHVVDRMQQLYERKLFPKLLKAQLLISEERFNEAKWILDQAENEFQANPDYPEALWAYYLYLTTMYSREDNYIDAITDEVEKIYARNTSDWRIGWLLLYLSEEFAISPSKKWLFIADQLEKGCISPMFYVEAINMLYGNPGLLSKLTELEIRIFRYAANKDLLTDDLIGQFVYLASKEKRYSDRVYKLLKKCYELIPSLNTATVICEHLIKGNRTDEEAHNWYLLAVEEELRITKLYEYFMESVDLSKDTKIPKMVYLYFSYESSLNWESAAYLYARVIGLRDSMPDVFESYKEQIEKFAVLEILEGHMNKDMAVIYRFVLSDVYLTDEMAKALSKVLFTHKISVDNKNFTKVCVYQMHECVETTYPVVDGTAYVPLYNRDFTILFEDGFTNRYSASAEYDLEMLMVPGRLAAKILPMIKDNLEFDVYACECSSEMVEITDETRERFANILNAKEIDEDYKAEIQRKLIEYYYDNDNIRELDEILESLSPDILSKKNRVQAVKYMILRGMYDKAFEWTVNYGDEKADERDLVKLCSKLISRNEYAPDDAVTRLSVSAFFKGKYDEVVLKYLVDNFTGLTKDMRKLFKTAVNFDVEIYGLCEKMLIQMLYTGYFVAERMDIYKKYLQGGANSAVQNAYITQCAFDYFVKEQIMEPMIFEELTKLKIRGEEMQTVSKLAYLKYYSENLKEIDETIKPIISEYLENLITSGIYMSFYKSFLREYYPGVDQFSDKTIVEYKTDPGKKVYIHYIIEGDEEVPGEYVTEEMQDMFGGVHAKAFILFFGENLLYYITEVLDGEEFLTESANIQKSDISGEIKNSRFNEVNDIVIAKTLQDYDTVNNLLYDYHKHAYVIKKLFTLQ